MDTLQYANTAAMAIEPDEHLTYLFARVAHRLQLGVDEALQAVPISLTQFSALAHIGRRPRIGLSDLARALLTTPQAAASLAKRLERDGFANRHVDGPGLAVRLTLTERGEAVLIESGQIATNAEQALLAHLPADTRVELGRILGSLLPGPAEPR